MYRHSWHLGLVTRNACVEFIYSYSSTRLQLLYIAHIIVRCTTLQYGTTKTASRKPYTLANGRGTRYAQGALYS